MFLRALHPERPPEDVRSGWKGGHQTGRADLLCPSEQRVREGKGNLGT